ncbi:MAG: glycosyltransferase family 2 protein [Paludibacteraceae bacterium]|nr:glycosyltransferase family 2 protein [Paludibacteraceae bacterium]MBP6284831.1 glycosyltransferase family 2 protein [Paludibacteraceae bacterium]
MKISAFIPYENDAQVAQTITSLSESGLVASIYLLATAATTSNTRFDATILQVDSLTSTQTIRTIAEYSKETFSLIYLKYSSLYLGAFALDRFIQVATDTQAGMVYADYYQQTTSGTSKAPVNDYQLGSVRDDFNFGSLLLFPSAAIQSAVASFSHDFAHAGMYQLRLAISEKRQLLHLNEFLYTEIEQDTRKSGEKQFDYVDPKNRAVQIEMEQACTQYLKNIGAYLAPVFSAINLHQELFEYEASVIIPVRNRAKTIEDAILSVLKQEASFPFNTIIIDNHSTDGTTEIIASYASKHKSIVHIIPPRTDLGIGGCWTEGIHHEACGKFAVQLDSDDLYENTNTLQQIVEAFYAQNCGMVIGSYSMTDVNLQLIPPGLIDHKEWTPENGRNNALRINGLGAPRAFYTPLLREIKVPNTSYGEDYALGLQISRNHQIGRIYNSVYLCRRWNENSDASLDIEKTNAHNSYKDKLRTIEITARIAQNK